MVVTTAPKVGEIAVLRGSALAGMPLGTILDQAEAHGRTQVWLHDSCLDALGLPQRLPERRKGDRDPIDPGSRFLASPGRWGSHTAGLSHHSYWFYRGGRGIDVSVPAWAPADSGNPFRDLGADELARQVERLHAASHGQIVWKGAATITSDALIRRTNRGLVPSPLPSPVTEGRGGELAYAWTSPHNAEVRGNYCYAYDLNLAYLNGASSLALGCGELVPAAWDTAPRPGWWRIEVPGWDTERLPTPWLEKGVRRGAEFWVTLPTARFASEVGANVREGWAFCESHRYLDRWYRVLRDARAQLMPGRGAAYEAVKMVAQHGLGRLGNQKRMRGEADPLYQPYWRNAVIAEMRTRLLRRVLRLKRYPVAIDADCAYFITNSPSPENFAEWAGIPLGEGLGQFKVAGALSARDARSMLAASPSTALDNLGRTIRGD